MRSLFARILLWFLATIAITFVGVVITTAISADDERGPLPPVARVVPFLLEEARAAYESGGARALAPLLDRVRASLQAEGVFTDASGRDLITGEDRSDLVEASERGPLRNRIRRGRVVIGRATTDGQYRFFLLVDRRRFGFWAFLPQHLWIITAAVLLCYWLAFHLASPVRRLQQTVEKFGQGDLSVRAVVDRRDELGQLAAAFNRMAGRLQTLLEAERRLLLDISHELRSPLARLGVAVELARSGDDRDAALDRIEKESARLNSLLGELLQVTRAEGDPSTLQKTPVRFDELVREIIEDNAPEATARGCTLSAPAFAPVEVRGDAELLRRAVENVIRNAIRYAPPGSAVEIALESRDGAVLLRVRDYGSGVPEDALPRLFDAFYRVGADRDRASGGAGLGLAIARRAVELHGGSIRAANAGPGLLVEIRLPSATADR